MRPEFTYSQIKKAEKFVEGKCIEYKGGGLWICKPLIYFSKKHGDFVGYNHTTYTIKSDGNYGFNCTCQAFVNSKAIFEAGAYDPTLPKEQVWPKCSHIKAVKLFEQLKKKKEIARRESQQEVFFFVH